MSIVPHYTTRLRNRVDDVRRNQDTDGLPVLNPSPGPLVDKTSVTWFRFLHDLSQAIPNILRQCWVHDWPTYRFIPDRQKEHMFLILTRKYMWDPRHDLTVWTNFNLVARTLYRSQMRTLRTIWAHNGEKPAWMIERVWIGIKEMFDEFGPDNFGF